MSELDAIRNHYKKCSRNTIENRLRMAIFSGRINSYELRSIADDLDQLDNLTDTESDEEPNQ